MSIEFDEDLDDDSCWNVEEEDYRPDDNFLISKVIDGRVVPFDGCVIEKRKRYYIEDLSERDYSLENTTPYQIKINDKIIEEHSWGDLLIQVTNYLIVTNHKSDRELLNFSCDWTKRMFFFVHNSCNAKQLSNGMYLDCNHTALHLCWLLQDLLDFFGMDKSLVYFLIHRPCGAEPEKIKQFIEGNFKNGFKEFLVNSKFFSEEKANQIINGYSYLNKVLSSMSKSYNNFFLFDDNAILNNYVSKVREKIMNYGSLSDGQKRGMDSRLDLLVEYYKQ